MAIEYRLSHTAVEIDRKLTAVDEIKDSLENNYYASTDIDTKIEEVNTSISEINASLEAKADLIDGKIPLEQLPDNIGSGGSGVASWNDLEDKPFYGDVESSKCTVLDPSTMTTATCAELGNFIKISDFTPTKTDFESHITFVCTSEEIGDEPYKSNQFDVLALTNDIMILVLSDSGVVLVVTYNTGSFVVDIEGEPYTFDVPEEGIYFMDGQLSPGYTTEIICDNCKTLDIKYLPKNMALGYEKKAFEDIIWDGNGEGLPSVSISVAEEDLTITWCKISDVILTKNDYINATRALISEGEKNSFVIGESDIQDAIFDISANGSYAVGSELYIINIAVDNDAVNFDDMFGLGGIQTFPEKGLWFFHFSQSGSEAYTSEFLSPTTLKQIDSKFITVSDIPESNDNNPITSDAVYKALGNRNQLTIDDVVSSESTNLITSGAVYEAIESKETMIKVTSDDNGKFIRDVDGQWAAVAMPSAEEGEF